MTPGWHRFRVLFPLAVAASAVLAAALLGAGGMLLARITLGTAIGVAGVLENGA